MIINATKFYTPVFVVLLLLQLYVPSFKINIFIQILALLMFVVIDRVSFSGNFLKHLFPFVVLLVLGFAGTALHKYKLFNTIKDVSHFIKPITGLLIGYFFYKKINNWKIFVKTIVVASVISAIIHFLIIIFLVRLESGSIHEIREFTRDNFLELFGLFFLLLYKRFYHEAVFKSKLYSVAAVILLIISISLYFSRTMIISGLILALSAFGYLKITSRSLKFITVLFLATGLFYAYLYNTNIRRDKPGIEAFLYKVKIAPAEIFETNVNRDNHKRLWDHWRGYEAKRAFVLMTESPSSYIFGTGHGSLVNLKFYAPLSDDKKGIRYISELHNGYMYIFYKTGIIGLFIYLLILFKWYLYAYEYPTTNMVALLISGISIIYFFSTLTITGMYNNKDILIMLMGALLHFIEARKALPPGLPSRTPLKPVETS